MQSREERIGQSNRNEDLSDFIGTGWYASATWFVTGEDKDDNINARRPLFQGGIGAIEIGVRYDELAFESASKTGHRLHQSARGAPDAEHRQRVDVRRELDARTAGSRSSPTRIRAELRGRDARRRSPGTTEFWSGLVRLQIVF